MLKVLFLICRMKEWKKILWKEEYLKYMMTKNTELSKTIKCLFSYYEITNKKWCHKQKFLFIKLKRFITMDYNFLWLINWVIFGLLFTSPFCARIRHKFKMILSKTGFVQVLDSSVRILIENLFSNKMKFLIILLGNFPEAYKPCESFVCDNCIYEAVWRVIFLF